MVKPRAVSRLTHTSRRTRACPCLKPTPRRAHTSSSVFLMLLLTQTTAMIGAVGTAETAASVVNISADDQNARIEYEQIRCLDYFDSQPATSDNGSFCPRVWDSLLCWPDTPAGVVAVQPCPDYVQGFKPWENATRECREDGTWYFDAHHNRSWTDYSFCTNRDPDVPVETAGDFVKAHMDRIRLMYNVGYGISLVSLVLSVFIMIGFKKLHCPRNTIHLNLFFSFILRASFSFMKENLLVQGLGFPSDVTRPSEDGPFIFKNGSTHWECKLFFTCFHYILGANYMWISAEALYLHILISVAVFSERSTIKWYILCGWGSPMLFVLPWVIVRAILEDVYCWNTHPTPGYFWIMRGPIVLSIVVNFVFFLNIVRVLFTKLNAVNSPEAKKFRYRKLAKSTLVLIPLFGVHYIVFAGLPKDVNPTAELIQLYFEMFFNSVQGFFVALLFCFLNGEVQAEIKKKWQRFRLTRFNHLPKGRSNSHNLTYATYLSRPRESNASVTQFQEARDPGCGNGSVTSKHDNGGGEPGPPISLHVLKRNQRLIENGSMAIAEAEEEEPMIGRGSYLSEEKATVNNSGSNGYT